MVKVPGLGKWLKAEELKPGSTAKILTEANWEEYEYKGEKKNQFVCNVDFNGEERKLKITMASCQEIAPIYGDDSKEWVGKFLRLESVRVMIGGAVKHSILASPNDVAPTTVSGEPWDAS